MVIRCGMLQCSGSVEFLLLTLPGNNKECGEDVRDIIVFW